MVKKYQDKEWLYQKYIVEKLSTYEIAKICGVGGSCIGRRLKRYNIQSRSYSECQKGLQVGKNNSMYGISRFGIENPMFGKHHSEKYKKESSESKLKNKAAIKYRNKIWLEEKYIKERKTVKEIANIIKVGQSTVNHWLKKYNILKRSASEWMKGKYSGKNNYFYEKHFDGKQNPFYGKKHTEETKRKMLDIGHSQISKKLWENPEYRKKMLKTTNKRPTNPEKVFDDITPDNVRYVGNGRWWRQINSHSRNPDFKITGQNKVIEIYGDYWHRNDNPDDLINEYKEVGLECLVFWESEVYKETDKVMRKVREFIEVGKIGYEE